MPAVSVLLVGLRVEVKKTALPGERSVVVCSYPDPDCVCGLNNAGKTSCFDAGTDDRAAAVGNISRLGPGLSVPGARSAVETARCGSDTTGGCDVVWLS
ncbi:unnamed protein product [Arctogadus glacialis]